MAEAQGFFLRGREKERVGVLPYKGFLKDKFDILHLKPSFKIVSDEIERLRLKF